MSTLLKIIVKNAQNNPNQFFFFQQPAIYTGGPAVYTNSVYQRTLQAASMGGEITFMTNLQFYAAVQETGTATPQIGQSSGFESAEQAIDLTAKGNSPPNHNCAAMSYDAPSDSLGLAAPVNTAGVQEGAFRVITAKYQPPKFFNVGSSVTVNGQIVLSNFVIGQPQTNVDCEPILKYYVQTGAYVPGTVMDFTESSVNAALCDFTGGYVQALVSYQSDGSWNVQMS